ncbi:glutamate receptor isoform X1 [Patella vulgata]|uniref:glutamate receptor isoform X1 n=2 Tax=Patella vulgata TaxID=6465 RepID=UPI0024A967BA|nr:glutamate receptor isoform X1 [Patella vulgata]
MLPIIRSHAENIRVPFISINNPAISFDERDSKFEYYIKPSTARAVVDLVEFYEWDKVYYFYDTGESLSRMEETVDHLHRIYTSPEVDVRHVENILHTYDSLKLLYVANRGDNYRIILDLEPLDTEYLLRALMGDKGVLKMRFHFLLPHVNMMELNLTVLEVGGVNVTGFQLKTRNIGISQFSFPSGLAESEVDYAVDAVTFFTRSLEHLQRRTGSERLFHKLHGWRDTYSDEVNCITDKSILWRYGNSLADVMSKTEFNGQSGSLAFTDKGQRRNFTLEVNEVTMYRGIHPAGVWNSDGYIPKGPTPILDKANRTIDNRTRIVVSIKEPPYIEDRKFPEGGRPEIGSDRFTGYCVELGERVSRIVNYDYHIRYVMDDEYGKKMDDGSWTGIIGELIRHEADLAIAPLTITSQREQVLDFTKPYMSLGISIMIKKPADVQPHVFSFMEPLSSEIWLCTAFAFIGVSVVLFLVSRFSVVEWQVEGGDKKLHNDFTIGNSMWFSLGAFMQQGCDVLPKSVSGRMVTSVWWFFTLIIISSYTANLAAHLTFMRLSTPIKSAEDLAKQTEIKYGTLKSGSTMAFFNGSTVNLFQRMWSYMTSQPDVFCTTTREGIERVRNSSGKYAFLIESTTSDYYNNKKPCETIKVGSNLDSKGYGIATPMGSDIRDMLTLAILNLREHGILEEMRKHWWYSKGECPVEKKSQESTENSLTLTKVAGIFYILVVGLALSVVAAVLEFLYKAKIDSRKQNVSFKKEARSKFRLSISGVSDDESMGVRTPLRSTTFTYTAYDGTCSRRQGKTQTIV